MATKLTRVPVPVVDRAKEVQEEYGYPTIGEAIRHMAQEGDYDV